MDAFHAANPKITVKVDRVRLGPLLGQAPDRDRRWRRTRRLRDGRPALPRLPVARRPARPQAVHRPGRLRPRPARRPGGRRLHHAGRPVRAAARPQRHRPLLQQEDVRRGRDPLPGRHLGLGEARRGRQEADDPGRRTARSASGASTPRRPTWRTTGPSSSGRTAATSCRPTRRRASSAATRRPAGSSSSRTSSGRTRSCRTRRSGRRTVATRSSRARRRWRPTDRGSWRPTSRPGSTSGSRRCRRARPARPPRSIRPARSSTRARRTRTPPGQFVKYLASPAAQTKLMELKASMPANKEVLAGPFSTSFEGAQVLADAIAYAHLKPSFKGYDEWTTALQTEIDANVFTGSEEDGQAGDRRRAAHSSTGSSPASDVVPTRQDRPGDEPAPPRPTAGRRAAGRRGPLGAGVPCADPDRPGRAVGGPDPGHPRDQPDEVGPAHGAEADRSRQLRRPAVRRPIPQGAPEHLLLHDRVGPARAGDRARARPGAEPQDPRHRLHPDRLLPAGRHLDDRDRPRLAMDLQPGLGPPEPGPRGRRDPGPELAQRPDPGDAVDRGRCRSGRASG